MGGWCGGLLAGVKLWVLKSYEGWHDLQELDTNSQVALIKKNRLSVIDNQFSQNVEAIGYLAAFN